MHSKPGAVRLDDLAEVGLSGAERRTALRFYADRFGVKEEA